MANLQRNLRGGARMKEKKEILFSVTIDDFIVSWFSGKGAGGQYRNKHQNCCRMVHKESGAMATGQSQRNRPPNQKEAFNNCVNTPIFKAWLSKKIYDIDNPNEESIDTIVDREMKKIKIEVMKNGEWEAAE